MRYFESTFKIRHYAATKGNHYTIHQHVENIIAGDKHKDKVKTPYLFDYSLDTGANQIVANARTIQPTHLPGEETFDITPKKGQEIVFGVHFRPQMNLTEGNKRHVYVQDKNRRIEKLIIRLEQAGLDPILVDELEETHRHFKKRQHKFFMNAARYLVEATIIDPSAFELAFTTQGVGPKASFGYGKMVPLKGLQS